MYIISSTNENPVYSSFVPVVYKMWKKLMPECTFILGYIGKREPNDPYVRRLSTFCDELHCFKTIPGITEGCQAKTTRMYLTTLYDNNVCSVVDIDQFVLNIDWFINLIQPALKENKFVSIGHNHYYNTPHIGKFPMAYTTAPSNVWKKIINPNNLSYIDWFLYICKLPNPIDNKENPSNHFNYFSDESLLRYFLVKHPDQKYINNTWIKIEREDELPNGVMRCARRIDRAEWNKFDINKMNEGYYLDANPLRPFDKYFNYLLPIVKYMNVSDNKKDLFL